jgi:hypothetical protein
MGKYWSADSFKKRLTIEPLCNLGMVFKSPFLTVNSFGFSSAQ